MPNTSSGYPRNYEWTAAASERAETEGWGIFDCEGSANGRTQLCRSDEADMFPDDAAAWLHVVKRARTGSTFHQRALALIAKYNPVEYHAITRATNDAQGVSTAVITVAGARDVAEFLERMIPTHCPRPNVAQWEAVRDALYAISNDTDAIVTARE